MTANPLPLPGFMVKKRISWFFDSACFAASLQKPDTFFFFFLRYPTHSNAETGGARRADVWRASFASISARGHFSEWGTRPGKVLIAHLVGSGVAAIDCRH
jgi:hypothetical protein